MRRASSPRTLLIALIGTALLGAPAVLLALAADRADPLREVAAEALAPDPPARASRTEGLRILREWDARRSAAWASGDAEALAALYTARSAAGGTDGSMLRRWNARGLVVESMQNQIKGATLIASSERRLVISVTERLVAAYAMGPAGRVALPQDRWSTRRVTLRKVEGRWLVSQSRAGEGYFRSPVAITPWTSRSRNS